MEFLTLDFFLLIIRILVDIGVFILILAMLKRISFLESQVKNLTEVSAGTLSIVKDHETDIRGIKNSFADITEMAGQLKTRTSAKSNYPSAKEVVTQIVKKRNVKEPIK